MADSSIEWTNKTWNPVTGCSKVSPGCAHCYAEALTMRYATAWKVPGLPWTPENAPQNVILKPERLTQPLKWKTPAMVFVNSMSDLFHELIPDDYIRRVFTVMEEADWHTFQVLTKRPERMRDFMRAHFPDALISPPPNVWLGTSIENRRFVHRADALRETPAAVRFISAEPLLGPLVPYLYDPDTAEPVWFGEPDCKLPGLDVTDIDWIILGGESGKGHRKLNPEWMRDIKGACLAHRSFFGNSRSRRSSGRSSSLSPGRRMGSGEGVNDLSEAVARASARMEASGGIGGDWLLPFGGWDFERDHLANFVAANAIEGAEAIDEGKPVHVVLRDLFANALLVGLCVGDIRADRQRIERRAA